MLPQLVLDVVDDTAPVEVERDVVDLLGGVVVDFLELCHDATQPGAAVAVDHHRELLHDVEHGGERDDDGDDGGKFERKHSHTPGCVGSSDTNVWTSIL